MACSHITKQDFEDLKKLSAELAKDFNLVPNKQEQLIRLPRGGLVISTSAGNIQFGMPPETVKDSIIMGIDVPEIYVLPTNRFDFHTCLNVAEFEFPVYFNFFVRRKKVRLVCTEEAKQAILAVFQETLLGPTSFEGFEEEFDRRFDPDAMPDFYKEGQHFAKNPFKPGESLTIDTVTEFIIFDEQNIAQITEDIQVRKRDDTFEVLEKGKAVAIVPDSVELGEPPHKERHNTKEETKHDNRQPTSIEEIEDLQGITPSSDIESVYFVPPSFGVTILGNSHGFDPQGCTSGYVIWINGRGVMVDPPPFSIQRLKRMGVASRLIESIIISHCHGDHDAGVFQKVLDTQQIEIITTRTIMKSFIRKYSVILKMTPEKTASLFRFKPVVIGAPLYLNGAVFKFFYSLHSIPAIGFEVFSHEKSLYFSADTFYEPNKMQEMVTAGVMSKQRCESLCNNKWNHNLILHEAGVPPIHTPMKILSELPEDVKKRTMLVHVAAKDVPHDSGLKIAPQGLQNTIILDPTPVDQLNLINVLDVVCSIDAFKNVPIRTMKDVIISADKEVLKSGKIIVDEGQIADKFYIIIEGIVRVLLSKPGQEFDRFYQVGDFFGESILSHKTRRLATAVAVTDVKLLVISKSDFIFFFGENKEILTKMNNLIQLRKYRVLQVLKQNSILSALSSSQKLHLETILQSHKVKANDQIWKKGETPEFAMLIYEGTVEVTYDSADFKEDEDNTDEFSVGVFISETQAMAENHKCKLSVKAMTDCHVFIIEKSDYLRFLSNNPKLNINLSGGEIFE